jgi:hypothetical protein
MIQLPPDQRRIVLRAKLQLDDERFAAVWIMKWIIKSPERLAMIREHAKRERSQS